MAVRIRLARMGKKKAPMYRIVAIDKRSKRDGAFLENLGTYNPLSGELVQFHAEKIQAWVEKGAQMSETVVKLQRQHKRSSNVETKAVAPVAKKAKKAEVQPEAAVAQE